MFLLMAALFWVLSSLLLVYAKKTNIHTRAIERLACGVQADTEQLATRKEEIANRGLPKENYEIH